MTWNVIKLTDNKKILNSFTNKKDAEDYIKEMLENYNLSGYDGEHNRWWGRNDDNSINHKFWIE